MIYRGLELDRFQTDAIAALDANKSVLVAAPTGTGKTIIADYIVDRALQDGQDVIYTAPIKALSNQKYRDYCRLYGVEKVGLVTGDLVIRRDAPCRVMTTEILRNMLLGGEKMENLRAVILDEVHFLDDPERGTVWEEVLIYLPQRVQIVALSATLPNLDELAQWMRDVRSREVEVVVEEERAVPLLIHYANQTTGISAPEQYKQAADRFKQKHPESAPDSRGRGSGRNRGPRGKGRHSRGRSNTASMTRHTHIFRMMEESDYLPYLYFAFSRKNCEKFAWGLQRKLNYGLLNDDEHARIGDILKVAAPEIGPALDGELRTLYQMGIAYHHAGLHVQLKALVESLYEQKLIKVLYCTSTFALGINMPARSVVFDSIEKYDGKSVNPLTMRQFMQKAGRAGRRGMDDVGHVVLRMDFSDYQQVHKSLSKYHHGNYEPVKSSFSLSFNSVINLMDSHEIDAIKELIGKSFLSWKLDRVAKQHEQKAKELEARLAPDATKKQRKEVRQLKNRANNTSARTWNAFVNKVNFLQHIGYLNDDHEFNAGARFLKHIQIADIFVTELMLDGLLNGLSDPILYGVLVGLTQELPRNTRCFIRLPTSAKLLLRKIDRVSRTPVVQQAAELSGQEVTWDFDSVALGHAWAEGKSLDEILLAMQSQTDVSGSIVSGFRRAKDLAGQIRDAYGREMTTEWDQLTRVMKGVTRDEVMVVD